MPPLVAAFTGLVMGGCCKEKKKAEAFMIIPEFGV
jgi:hypothetical protein